MKLMIALGALAALGSSALAQCSSSFSYADFTLADPGDFAIVGDAALVEGVLQLTQNTNGQAGAVWYMPSRTSVADGFDCSFTFRIREGSADGLAFVIQNESLSALGGGGSGNGFGSDTGPAGITRSIAVQIDTFSFGPPFELEAPSISVQTRGLDENCSACIDGSLGSFTLANDPADGEEHTVFIEYRENRDAQIGRMRITYEGQFIDVPVYLHDLNGGDIFDVESECAYIGFTAATGGATAIQEITSWTFNDEPDTSCVAVGIDSFPDMSPRQAFQRAEFTVVPTGSFPMEHRWVLNGIDLVDDGRISGATTATLVIDPILSSDAGQLDFSYSNQCSGLGSGFELVVICFADFNQDGGIDGSDIDAFFTAWEAGEPAADVSADGGVDGGDIEAFFTSWEAGSCG
jgi:hypothetical protein